METAKAEITVPINNTPEGVMEYIADVRNRPLFLSVLKSVTDIKGNPSAVGTSWKWTAAGLGMEFEGVGCCVKYEAGVRYVSKTEGGIEGAVTYRVQPEAQGTKLTIESEYGIPGKISSLTSGPKGGRATDANRGRASRREPQGHPGQIDSIVSPVNSLHGLPPRRRAHPTSSAFGGR